MKNFRVGNIIEANGHLTAIYECCNDVIWFHDSKGNVDFFSISDKRIKDVELSTFLLDKMFMKELRFEHENFYSVWIINPNLKTEIREAIEGFNILCNGFEMFKIFSVRQLQNAYALLYENPIIGCGERSDSKTPKELDEKLRNILKIG